MIFEIIYNLIVSPPKVDIVLTGEVLKGYYNHSLDSIILVISLGKSYHFLRAWIHY